MNTTWVVEIHDELYGPFTNLQAASLFCDRFQARGRLKIRTLTSPEPPSQRDIMGVTVPVRMTGTLKD